MTSHPDSEEALELATLHRLAQLGWTQTAVCQEETAGNCFLTGRGDGLTRRLWYNIRQAWFEGGRRPI